MKRSDYVREIAPPSPPCFMRRESWLEYLESAADAEKPGRGAQGPVILDRSGVAVFNRGFNYCHDCEPEHRDAMIRAGRCKPDFLRDDNVLVVKARPQVAPIVIVRNPAPAQPAPDVVRENELMVYA